MILTTYINNPIKKINYTVNEKTFYNPYAAFLYAAHNCFHKHVNFNVFEKDFSNVDWTVYPEISYDNLFFIRAKQLRKKHNKLGVMFSGGTDSTTVISSFLDNNIPIDFVVLLRSNLDSKVNSEFKNLFPVEDLIAWIKTRWPEKSRNIEFIIVDFIELNSHLKLFNTEESILSETETKKVHFFNSLINNNIKEAVDKKILSDWKLITGHEIPNVSNEKSYFVDKTFVHVLNKDWIEFFFLTPDLPEISIKQAHDHAKYNKLYSVAKEFPPLPIHDCDDPSLDYTMYTIKKRMLGCKDEVKSNLSLTDKRIASNYRNIILETDFSNKNNIDNFESSIKSTLYGSYFHNSYKNKKELKNWYNGLASLASDKTLIEYMVRHGYLDNHSQLPHNYNGLMSSPNLLFQNC